MADLADKRRLENLGKRIDEFQAVPRVERPAVEDHHSQAQLAWRMVIELVAGIVIGFGMGYGLDSLFGTIPLFLIVMTLLGFVAGVRTMLRSAEEVRKETAENAPPGEDGEDEGGR